MKKLTWVVALFGLLFATSVFAEIVSGLSTTNISNDVTLTQLTLTKPGDAVTGAFLLADVSINGGSPATIVSPSGWTLIQRTDNDSSVGIASYWKIVGTSEPSTYTWTITPQTRAAGGITTYSGIDTSNPIDTSIGATNRGTIATAPSVTTTQDGSKIIAIFSSNFGTNNAALFSTTTGMVKRYSVKNVPFGPTTAIEDKTQTVMGSIGPFSVTISQGPQRDWAAQTIALRALPALSGAVAYWKLDGNSTDSAGNNNGVDTNISYAVENGKINSGAGFDGSSSYINISGMLSGPTDFSICAWVKTSSNTEQFILSQRDSSGVDGEFMFGVTNGEMFIVTNDNAHGTGFSGTNLSGTNLADNNWHLACFASHGTTGTFYLDGSLDGTLTANVVVTLNSSLTGAIGYDKLDNLRFWNGSIDEIGIWSRALSATEIVQLYNSGSGLQYPF